MTLGEYAKDIRLPCRDVHETEIAHHSCRDSLRFAVGANERDQSPSNRATVCGQYSTGDQRRGRGRSRNGKGTVIWDCRDRVDIRIFEYDTTERQGGRRRRDPNDGKS